MGLFGWLKEESGGFATAFALLALVTAGASVAVVTRQRRWSVVLNPAGASA